MAALEDSGKAEKTLVIFSSDNGGQQNWTSSDKQYDGRYATNDTLGNNLPLRGWKTDLYEGGIRVPAFAYWPGVIEPGQVIESPTHICDWTPTLIGLAGGKVDESWKLDGVDIAPLFLTGAATTAPRTLYWRTNAGIALREGDWKLILSGKGEKAELFHLGDDPNETTDRSDGEAGRVKTMRERVAAIRAGDDTEK